MAEKNENGFIDLEIPFEPTAIEAAPEAKKKDPRGRKKGVPNKPKEPEQTTSFSGSNEADFFAQTKKAAQEKKEQDKQTTAPTPEGAPVMEVVQEPSLITGYMMLIICDAFVPQLLNKFIFKVDKKKLVKLDKQQLNEMKPIADAAAMQLFKNVSPVSGFFIAYTAITISNNLHLSNEK